MKKGTQIHGFTVTDLRDIPSINSTVILLEHDITKAKAMKILNEDDNKAFGISFRTPPKSRLAVSLRPGLFLPIFMKIQTVKADFTSLTYPHFMQRERSRHKSCLSIYKCKEQVLWI